MVASAELVSAAVNRFGLGAKPGELAGVSDPRAWLTEQVSQGIDGAEWFAGLPSSLDYLGEEARLQATRRQIRRRDNDERAGGRGKGLGKGPGKPAANGDANAAALKQALAPYRETYRKQFLAEVAARYRAATATNTPFIERLVYFWSNHFAVSIDKRPARMLAAPMEREAIRPHVTGRFADMLLAVETHPAMLEYLDNVRSIGPDSPLGRRISTRLARKGDKDKGKAGGLNENLGREAMELHTVGVGAGYTQTDVTELSRALTGWSVALPRDFGAGRRPASPFVFRAAAHEPGPRRVMGTTYPAGGFDQAKAILEDLARKPSTANQLCGQLARHFVSDDPPPALVERMAATYLDRDTDLAAVYRTLIESPEAWAIDARKFKSPQDFMISALRAAQIDFGARPQPILALLKNLGEPLFDPRSPAGFSDSSANWIDADGLWKRVQAAEALSSRIRSAGMQALALAENALGPRLDDDTAEAIRRAESSRQAHATLFASPAFQWRA